MNYENKQANIRIFPPSMVEVSRITKENERSILIENKFKKI